ncbi:hypothetical protein HUT18_30285 [Streptomyces sp. NA04227]|uniref:hypothetical protein n=1 Tax=Streptomyces sp. NA04227 TaxID=2742136 RepID=UPI00159085FA|nr:hypothetical protein [Streptomyces sp. NA04227]QKW10070.1 hypothetical protein HUT18_30285 [Streptomyces sp. NA04227]
MARTPTAAQLRVVVAADPGTGRLKGTENQLAALVRLCLAFRHPRPPHDCYLTPAGQRLREAETAPAPVAPASGSGPAREPVPTERPEPGPPPAAEVFTSRPGDPDAPADGPGRRHEVRSAWQGLLELRRMTNPDGASDRPCGWERTHLISAAALALEAAGHRPASAAGAGYRVTDTAQPEAVAVHAYSETELGACAQSLAEAGWQTGQYTGARPGNRFVLASPRRT